MLFRSFISWIKALRPEVKQKKTSVIEKIFIEKNGERHCHDLMLYPLVTNGVEGAVIRIEDTTERTRIQELMVQTQKMMSVGGLAAGMAHEINNPLGGIVQAIQNIERRISADLPVNHQIAEEVRVDLEAMQLYLEKRQIPRFFATIRDSVDRAAKIVSNMLQFSRRAPTSVKNCFLSDLMDEAVELAMNDFDLKRNYDFRNIRIVREYAENLPEVPVVAVEIEQVLLNLLKNAAQAMIVNPPEKKARIVLRLAWEGRYARMEVEDNGPGMSEDIRLRVFEPFFTTKEPGAGTGLGLSVSYMIVTQNHRGLMEVESSPGKGVCFRIRLPFEASVRQESPANCVISS